MPNLIGVDAVPYFVPAKIGPFAVANLAISQAQVALKLLGDTLNVDEIMPYAGSIIGIYFELNTNKTAGVLQCSPTINTTEVASTNTLYRIAMANAARKASQKADAQIAGLRFAANDALGIKVTTDAGFLPAASANLLAWLLVVWEAVQP